MTSIIPVENFKININSTYNNNKQSQILTKMTQMIKQIKPYYLFKGSDYKNKKIVGSNFVIKNGGKVKILSNIKGISTTNIINNI